MAETSSLVLKVDSRDVKQAKSDLDNLSNSAGRTEKSVDSLSISFSTLSKTLGTIGVGALIKEFMSIADEMNLLDARLKMVSSSTAEYVSQKKELLGIAKETYSSISDITTLYTKLDPALKALGATTKDVNDITETFAKGLKLGGASAQESASATLQFAQAMGSGVLRGEEFNAIMEASPKLMAYLAEGLGVPQTALRKMAMEGELSAGRVSSALLKMSSRVNEDFTKIPITVGMATTNLKTDLAKSIEEFDKTTGATKALAETISGMSVDLKKYGTDVTTFFVSTSKFIEDHNDALKTTASLVGGVATAYYGFIAGGAVISGIRGITTAIYGLRTAMIALQASSPILLGISVALGVATSAYLAHDNALEKKNYSTSNSIDELVKAHDRLIKKRKEIQSDKFALDSTQKKETAIVDAELKKIEDRLNQIGKSRSDNVAKAKEEAEATAKASKALEESAKKLPNDKSEKEAEKARKKAEKEREKAQKEADKEAEKAKEKEAEIQLKIQHKIGVAEFDTINRTTKARQDALDLQEQAENDSYVRRGEFILAQQESTLSDVEKINRDNLATLAQMEFENAEMVAQGLAPIFDDSAMNVFFNNWNEQLDKTRSGYQSIIDEIDGLAPSSKDWTAGLKGQAKNVANVLNATLDLTSAQKKMDKERTKIQSSNLTTGEKEIALDKLKTVELEAQMAGYANLAGAMASAFEEGSAGAIAFTTLQSALGIASSWTAIAEAWALGFPQNIPAVAMVTSAVMPIISQLGGSSGGGGGSSAGGYASFSKSEMIEKEYNPIIDRLDKQIDLLDSIDKNGSAQLLSVRKGSLEFERDLRLLIEESFKPVSSGGTLSKKGLDLTSLRDVETFLAFASEVTSNLDAFKGKTVSQKEISRDTFITNLQEVISDFALNMGDAVSEMSDAKDEFKQIFDDITGTMTYATQDIQDAFADVRSLIGSSTLPEYLQTQIQAIADIERIYGDNIESILSLNNTFEQQADALKILNAELGTSFEAGSSDALDYIDSIKLVGETMAESRQNIDTFMESLRNPMESADNLATELGINLATSVESLASLFNQLSTDTEGLTSKELDLLEANKALLENTDAQQDAVDKLNEKMNDTTSKISSLKSIFQSIQSVIDKLRGASIGGSQSLELFWESINNVKVASEGDDIEKFSKAVSEMSSLSSILTNTSAFGSVEEMTLAQQIASNELEGINVKTETQIDYLKMIEENTRTQIAVMTNSIDNMVSSINSRLYSALGGKVLSDAGISSDAMISAGVAPSSIPTIYSKASNPAVRDTVPQWSGDVGLFAGGTREDWLTYSSYMSYNTMNNQETMSKLIDQLPSSTIDSLRSTYVTYMDMKQQGQEDLPNEMLKQAYMDAGLPFLGGLGLEELFPNGYASGGYTGDIPTNAVAGFVHGQEYVVNAKTTRDLGLNNNAGLFASMAENMSKMAIKIDEMANMALKQTSTQIKMLSTQRAILSESAL